MSWSNGKAYLESHPEMVPVVEALPEPTPDEGESRCCRRDTLCRHQLRRKTMRQVPDAGGSFTACQESLVHRARYCSGFDKED
jgi:hypothetical protein